MPDCLSLWEWLSDQVCQNFGTDYCGFCTSSLFCVIIRCDPRKSTSSAPPRPSTPSAQLLSRCVLLCMLLRHSATFCVPPHLFVSSRTVTSSYPSASYLLPPSSLSSCVSQLSCHKNELNLSPSVQTTIDRVGTFRKTNRYLLSLLGIGSMCFCARVHVFCWWGWGGRWGTGLCQRGTQGHLLTCHPPSVCWTSKRSRQMMLIIISSPVVRLRGLHSCLCWAPDAYY